MIAAYFFSLAGFCCNDFSATRSQVTTFPLCLLAPFFHEYAGFALVQRYAGSRKQMMQPTILLHAAGERLAPKLAAALHEYPPMERIRQISKFLEGASPEEEDRRGAILDRLLRAFNEGGEEAATASLDGQMKDLEHNFNEALCKLEGLL
jgi:hypothetical protein